MFDSDLLLNSTKGKDIYLAYMEVLLMTHSDTLHFYIPRSTFKLNNTFSVMVSDTEERGGFQSIAWLAHFVTGVPER